LVRDLARQGSSYGGGYMVPMTGDKAEISIFLDIRLLSDG
jgi:hypothetical protein